MTGFLVIDLEGPTLLEIERHMLSSPKVGSPKVAGVILFSRNFKNTDQLQQLTYDIYKLRPDIFICVDHEGGFIQRFLRNGFRAIPAPRVLGEIYDKSPAIALERAKQYGKQMATDLLKSGVDLSLGPVLDIHGVSKVIAGLDRAFHEDPVVVAELSGAFIDGMQEAGMPCVAKHFPGHGSVLEDSHYEKPVDKTPYEVFVDRDLAVFARLMAENKLDAVMFSHVIYENFDAKPAGYSEFWYQLLSELVPPAGLDPVRMSDDVGGMEGANMGSVVTNVQLALNAGCDLILACQKDRATLIDVLNNVDHQPSDDSIARIETFVAKMQIQKQVFVSKMKEKIDLEKASKRAKVFNMAQQCIDFFKKSPLYNSYVEIIQEKIQADELEFLEQLDFIVEFANLESAQQCENRTLFCEKFVAVFPEKRPRKTVNLNKPNPPVLNAAKRPQPTPTVDLNRPSPILNDGKRLRPSATAKSTASKQNNTNTAQTSLPKRQKRSASP